MVSASTPAGSDSTNIGRNTAACTSVARNDEPVRSTNSQAVAITCVALAIKLVALASQTMGKAQGAPEAVVVGRGQAFCSRFTAASSHSMPLPGRSGTITAPSRTSNGDERNGCAQSRHSSQSAVSLTRSKCALTSG